MADALGHRPSGLRLLSGEMRGHSPLDAGCCSELGGDACDHTAKCALCSKPAPPLSPQPHSIPLSVMKVRNVQPQVRSVDSRNHETSLLHEEVFISKMFLWLHAIDDFFLPESER
ncbi:hypothetical protein C0Q70_01695 [Pomacea canaliculata]|uniref:Uncharacterized protein n=1 Tax=Pomacea canaliculata TaxID=400727 RepID=A0A2T7Q0A0_POMCA|nr:hypothetical protein C0Q70_01695 [Pomacea canaliculata]